MSRRLDRLEEALGRRLFHRHSTGLTLADGSHPLIERAGIVMDDVERRGRPASPEDLSGFDLITCDERLDPIAEARWLMNRGELADVAMRLTTVASIVATVRSGAGIAVLPAFLTEGLVVLYDGLELPQRNVWIAAQEDVRDVPRVAAVWDFVVEEVSAVLLGPEVG